VSRTADDPIRVVLLVGMMGAGKSSVGSAAARILGWPYLDNDEQVRELAGIAPPDVASRLGIQTLHRYEREAFDVVLAHPGPIVAGAAGSVVDDVAWRERHRHDVLVVWLRARPETLLARVGAGGGRRADAQSAAWTKNTLARREPALAALADLVIDVDERSVDECAAALVAMIEGRRRG
jgi:shikimate kinase